MKIKDLLFTDIYIGASASWITGVPDSAKAIVAPIGAEQDIAALRELCREACETHLKDEFTIRYDDVTYRASTINSLTDRVFVLRRFPDEVPMIEELGIHSLQVKQLMEDKVTGLLIVAGSFGQGKTTTASSLVKSRLIRYGGIAVTIEDPPEMPLEGQHGNGMCYQTWAEQGGFGYACRQAARWAPTIIFIGEVRDADAAQEALKASLNGRLVVCTLHADNIPAAVERMYSYAATNGARADDTASLLANGLAGVIHQRFEGTPRRIKTEFLWLANNDSHGPRNMIKQKRFDQLENEIRLQFNRMLAHTTRMAGQ